MNSEEISPWLPKAKIFKMDGILNLNKPAGITSARAVARVKKLLPRKIKIGHAGTLDPFATGVLLLLIGRATKQCERLMDEPKQYDATISFGATTATDDPESPPIAWSASIQTGDLRPTQEDISTLIAQFKGQINQIPPIFSALRINGHRSYDLARKGTPPIMVARPVMIYDIQLLSYVWPEARIRVDCGRGTYIRALARDIGAALNVGGHLTQLQRTRIGQFNIDSALGLEQLSAESLESHLVPISEIISTREYQPNESSSR